MRVLDASNMVHVGVRQHDFFKLVAIGEFLQTDRQKLSPLRYADAGIEQQRTAPGAYDVSIRTGPGERTRIMSKHGRHAGRQPRVVRQLQSDHRIGHNSPGFAHAVSLTNRRLRSKIRRRPLSVRNSSTSSIVSDSGAISSARPPVAITWVFSPRSRII